MCVVLFAMGTITTSTFAANWRSTPVVMEASRTKADSSYAEPLLRYLADLRAL